MLFLSSTKSCFIKEYMRMKACMLYIYSLHENRDIKYVVALAGTVLQHICGPKFENDSYPLSKIYGTILFIYMYAFLYRNDVAWPYQRS
jgi:hypothetical protein